MKKIKINLLVSLIFFVLILLVVAPVIHAQNWIELPPYNTLWPLWSPVLSPIDSITGLPTPVVSSLAADTLLPVMPALTWDPSLSYPWLLYNTPQGMTYFDPLAGINLWPAPSLLDSLGAPFPLALPPDYANLPPTDATWLANNVNVANNSFLLSYPSFLPAFAGPAWLNLPPTLSDLLTGLDILGPILGAPGVLAPPPAPLPLVPTISLPLAPTVPVPTIAAPPVTTVLVAEQAGTWLGNWYLGFLWGDMTMVLVVDPVTGYLSGTVTLLGNLALSVPIDVFGTASAGGIDVSGIDASGLYALNINGILTSPTDMTGTWTVIKISTGLPAKNGVGNFEVSLVDTVTFTTPTVVPVIPAPTALAPIPPLPTAGLVPTSIVPITILPPIPVPTTTAGLVPIVTTTPVVAPPLPTVTLAPLPIAPTILVPPVPAPITALAPTPIVVTLPVPPVPVPTAVAPTAAISQLVPFSPFAIAEQVGSWTGIWSAGLYSGPMSLNLIEVIDPLLGTVTLAGYAQLLGNPYLGALVDNISGEALNNQIYLSGSGLGAGSTTYQIEIVGTLTTATTMTGTYTLINSSSIREVGSFDLSLLPPII